MANSNIVKSLITQKQAFFISCRESRIENSRSFYGSFYLGPFHSGQSLTVANALRRTLLSELKGLAITSAEISGAVHEYSILPGVRESVLDILLNLKEIVLKTSIKHPQNLQQNQMAYIQVRGPGVIRAKDIKLPVSITCVDPEQYIATLADDGILNIQLKIQQGKNYIVQKPATFLKNSNWKEIQLRQLLLRKLTELKKNAPNPDLTPKPLSIDAVFMPITRVNYVIQVQDNLSIDLEKNAENFSKETFASFEDSTNKVNPFTTSKTQEKTNHIIVLDIWTNGSIHPREALYTASHKLLQLFANIEKVQIRNSLLFKTLVDSEKNYEHVTNKLQSISFNPMVDEEEQVPTVAQKFNEDSTLSKQTLEQIKFVSSQAKKYWTVQKLKLTEINNLNISLRPYTCLKRANIQTLYDLIHYPKSDLLKLKNFGYKSLEEVELSLKEIGIQLTD
uniref:DNA-directed RNA polymerase subunit alpha n=1 Tax=Spermatozopsis similis TaxID=3192 RepID=A0A499S699_SPESI|nr:RNA polymerase alpha subunit [Spermatozopsis similis]AYQ95159.1 RNA polymerase alpha subunit [Spermatozopsis similis]